MVEPGLFFIFHQRRPCDEACYAAGCVVRVCCQLRGVMSCMCNMYVSTMRTRVSAIMLSCVRVSCAHSFVCLSLASVWLLPVDNELSVTVS